MAGTNDFKAFATDANANVTSQEEWETLTALKKGFSSGKASSAQVSKALRQPSTMAAVLGQFIANAELDALDDGDVDGLVAKLATAITTNLGLGEAATRNVGTDTGQVPDMSSFTTGHSGAADWPNPKSGWSKGPDGVITQWGIFGFPVGQTGTNVVFPLPFPARVESITLTMADIQESLLSPTTMPAYGVNSTGTSRTGFTARMSGSGGFNLCYIAKGR
ncbi:hypothetical protein [Escherichia coli]|uniref:gp53-like domain-containing protein n=2 Tax=Escherichia coli TaxID=562 RepID=UPI001CED899C|nr:hypothetical protein [Escherichia coli]MCS7400861.1 hypothetical protein [Escherichia coli]